MGWSVAFDHRVTRQDLVQHLIVINNMITHSRQVPIYRRASREYYSTDGQTVYIYIHIYN